MANDPVNDAGTWKVFISYSWDSEQFKAWVLEFANRLRADGIDTILDQTHLHLEGRSPEFMERSVRDSRAVLVICTEVYKQRFDGRKGGAGYEGHIITGEIQTLQGPTSSFRFSGKESGKLLCRPPSMASLELTYERIRSRRTNDSYGISTASMKFAPLGIRRIGFMSGSLANQPRWSHHRSIRNSG